MWIFAVLTWNDFWCEFLHFFGAQLIGLKITVVYKMFVERIPQKIETFQVFKNFPWFLVSGRCQRLQKLTCNVGGKQRYGSELVEFESMAQSVTRFEALRVETSDQKVLRELRQATLLRDHRNPSHYLNKWRQFNGVKIKSLFSTHNQFFNLGPFSNVNASKKWCENK